MLNEYFPFRLKKRMSLNPETKMMRMMKMKMMAGTGSYLALKSLGMIELYCNFEDGVLRQCSGLPPQKIKI